MVIMTCGKKSINLGQRGGWCGRPGDGAVMWGGLPVSPAYIDLIAHQLERFK